MELKLCQAGLGGERVIKPRYKLDAPTKARLRRDGEATFAVPVCWWNSTVLGYGMKSPTDDLWTQLDWSHAWLDSGGPVSEAVKADVRMHWQYLHVKAWDDGCEVVYRVRARLELGDKLGGARLHSVLAVRDLTGERWLWVLHLVHPKRDEIVARTKARFEALCKRNEAKTK